MVRSGAERRTTSRMDHGIESLKLHTSPEPVIQICRSKPLMSAPFDTDRDLQSTEVARRRIRLHGFPEPVRSVRFQSIKIVNGLEDPLHILPNR